MTAPQRALLRPVPCEPKVGDLPDEPFAEPGELEAVWAWLMAQPEPACQPRPTLNVVRPKL